MNRVARTLALAMLAALPSLAVAATPVHAERGTAPLVPPDAQAYGKSFAEWHVLQIQRAIAKGLGGGTDLGETVGRVRLFPAEDPSPVFEVALPAGTPFVASPFFVFGERYDDPAVPDDDPVVLAALLEEIFATADIRTVLDGRVLLDGTGTELDAYRFDPVFFDAPIPYAEPQPRGDGLHAVAALWVTGIGSLYRPLPPGQHTLVYTIDSAFFGDLRFTYNITVSAR